MSSQNQPPKNLSADEVKDVDITARNFSTIWKYENEIPVKYSENVEQVDFNSRADII